MAAVTLSLGGQSAGAGDERSLFLKVFCGEVMAAMSDPKYGTDSAYRTEVERKLSVTPDTVF